MGIIRANESITIKKLCILISCNISILHLTNVVLMGDSSDLHEFSRVIRNHPFLKEITFINVTLGKSRLSLDNIVCTIFASVPKLEKIHLENVNVDALAFATVSHTQSKNLQVFQVPNNDLDDASAVAIASAISTSKTIKEVDLSNNKLSDKGCSAIANALEKNSSVCKIKLDGNGGISPEQLRMIAAMTRQRIMPEAA